MKEGKRQRFVTHVVTLTTPRGKNTPHVFVSQRGTFAVAAKIFEHSKLRRLFFKTVLVSCLNSMYQLGF